jgi:cytoskeletal protein CcmA (bactofilin family)
MRIGKEKPDKIDTIIGPHAHFEGILSSRESVRIEGEVRGKVECDGSLVIGSGGRVDAEIFAGNVFVAGRLTGNVTARKRLEIIGKGKVHGNIVAAELVMREGVALEGRCRMSSREDASETPDTSEEVTQSASCST